MSEKRTVETGNAGGGWSRESKRGSHLHIADRGRVEAAHKSVEVSLPPGAFFGKRISSCCWKVMRAAATALVTAAAITSSRLAGNCGAMPVEGPLPLWKASCMVFALSVPNTSNRIAPPVARPSPVLASVGRRDGTIVKSAIAAGQGADDVGALKGHGWGFARVVFAAATTVATSREDQALTEALEKVLFGGGPEQVPEQVVPARGSGVDNWEARAYSSSIGHRTQSSTGKGSGRCTRSAVL